MEPQRSARSAPNFSVRSEQHANSFRSSFTSSFTTSLSRTSRSAESLTGSAPGLRMLTGDRPTGYLHLGHYFGTIRERVRLQQEGIEAFLVLADYQVITDRETTGRIREFVGGAVLDYLAAGLDPDTATIFTHSAVPALNQLLLPFLSLVTETELHRNPTVKSELEASGRSLSGLLLTYPVHQAADILFCKANLIPVGKDQLPHVELTRVIARRFNERYGRIFPQPEAVLTSTPELPGLDGRKMSKSHGNAIALSMTEDETAAIIRRARTDSEKRITFDPVNRPGISSLLMTAAMCRDTTPEKLADELGNSGASALKSVTTDAVNDFLAEHRRLRREFSEDPDLVRHVLERGNRRANEVANSTLAEVRDAMGMTY